MKSLILGLALIVAPTPSFAANAPLDSRNDSLPGKDGNGPGEDETITPDLYLIHAMHLANLSANRAVIGTYLAPGSQALHEQGFAILGRSALLEIKLSFLAKPYGVDFTVAPLPSELDDEKALIDAAIETLNASDETTVDQAFLNAMEVVKSFEGRILEAAGNEALSPSVRDFALANYSGI